MSRRSLTCCAFFCGSPEPSEANKLIPESYRWRKTALASLLAAICGLSATNALALALGRITVQSALGDPLRAEIDILDINAEETASLKTSLALPEAFKAAGYEYNPALAGAQISLQRRADGRAFIRLTTDKPVTEPFVDLIVETSWASGRIVRDYAMLLDPPSLRAATAVAPSVPQVSAATISAANAVPSRPPPARTAPVTRKAPSTVAVVPAAAKPPEDGQKQVVVRSGDSASRIAAATRPAEVSLDQMLVALLRANQDAFVNSNLNRLKAGAVLTIPTAEQAQALTAPEAAKTVIAQSRDFNDFRSQLATNAPNLQVAAADRKAGGNVQTQVDDKKATATAPDKLTLSKGAVQAKAAEERIAQDKTAKDVTQRTAELSKNIKDLSSLGAASGTATPAAPAAPAAVSVPLAPPVVAVLPTPVVIASASSPQPTPPTSTAVAKSTVSVAASPPTPRPKPVPPAEPALVDRLLENPVILLAAAALIALLAGLGLYKARQRRNVAEVDSAFLESRLQPDSFFGASGGQRVDTNDGPATGSSMVYSPSQLDAADDVDPVAEADVYLAYGRDLQAEEILKEALRTHAGRIAVHQKLLDIYAKRRDAKAFQSMALDAFKLTGDQSPEWARICEQGLGIDPTNELYQPGGDPSSQKQPGALPATDDQNFVLTNPGNLKLVGATAATNVPAPVDLDLDLDFSLDEEVPSAIVEAQPSQLERTGAITPIPATAAALDFDFDLTPETTGLSQGASEATSGELNLPDLSVANDPLPLAHGDSEDFRQQAEVSFGSTNPVPLQANSATQSPFAAADTPLPDLSFDYTSPSELTASQAPPKSPPPDSGMLEFDLGTLSLDLDPIVETSDPGITAEPEDPLATKLALAEEFVSIGDDDGARALIEEVIAEASGDLKVRAQRALNSLS